MALDRRYWIWDLVLLLALSTALRAHNLGALSFCSEEADNALIARTCLQTGHFIQPESQPSSDGLLYPWITASLFNHFGESEWIARFPSAFFGALTTLWVYLWASHWFGSWVGRCAGFLFAVWPWSVAWGRIGQYESLLAFLFVLIVVSVWKMLECNCLGHPMAEPPRVAGRRPLTIRRFFKLIPFLLLALLAHFTSYLTHFALFFLPGYLLIRLSWSWFRGRFIDSEFKRSLQYLFAGLLVAGVGILALVYLSPAVFLKNQEQQETTGGSLCYIHIIREQFGWAFMGFLILGTGMALKSGRPGWLVFSAAWFPFIAQGLLLEKCQPDSIYYTFPFMVILAAIPIGWGTEMVKERVNQWSAPGVHWNWRGITGLLLLGLSVEMVLSNVFISRAATSQVVTGASDSVACGSLDWRGMTDLVPRASGNVKVISTDAIPVYYYLGRVDFVFPLKEGGRIQVIPGVSVQGIRSPAELVTALADGRETWIFGEKSRLAEMRRTPTGADLWSILTLPPSRVWEGPLEIVICYPKKR